MAGSGSISALQTALYDALVADAGVGALIGDRIYDGRPSDGTFPCITFGPIQALEDDADGITAQELIVQLDLWSRDNGRLGPVRDLMAAVRTALHETALALADPYAEAGMRVEAMRDLIDADGITAHGIVSLQVFVEG